MPVEAIAFASHALLITDKVDGSFYIGKIEDGENDEPSQFLWFICPCGCKDTCVLVIGNRFKPDNDGHSSWMWNGNSSKPTLTPSVHRISHWHGWLTDGVWRTTNEPQG